MKYFFSSGHICKIFKITKQTLLFYDQIDLIKPVSINPDTNYRYYSVEQFPTFYLIIALKTSGMELKKIKEYLKVHSIENTKDILEGQINNISRKIEELQNARSVLTRHYQQINNALNTSFKEGFFYKNRKKQFLYTFPIEESDNSNSYLLTFSKLINESQEDIAYMKWEYGWIVTLKPEGTFKSRKLFIETEHFLDNNHTIIRPEGNYLYTYHTGSYDSLEVTRQKLLDYADHNNLAVLGYIYEKQIINQFFTDNSEQFVTEVSIAVH